MLSSEVTASAKAVTDIALSLTTWKEVVQFRSAPSGFQAQYNPLDHLGKNRGAALGRRA